MSAFMLALAAVVVAADPPKDDVNQKDLERLQGVWKLQGMREDGKVDLGPFEDRYVISEGKLGMVKGDFEASARLKIDATKEPATFDVTFDVLPVALHGIYQVKGDTLAMCYTDDARKERPKEFDAKKGSPYKLAVFKREKAPDRVKPAK
jgi:uncharacterized protein (TIGR03067 family)